MHRRKKDAKDVILVTGGAGFMGSHFADTLVTRYRGAHIVVVDALTSVSNKQNIHSWDAPNFSFEKCDIRDRKRLARIFKKWKPTLVAHFAAETHVDVSITRPQIFLETNVLGTLNMLSASHAVGDRRFLHISTDEVYGTLSAHAAPFSEKSPLVPRSPYSASKAGAEHIVNAFNETFGLPVVIARTSNNYGPRQDGTKFIPLFTTKFLKGKKAPLYGTGRNVRDWLYVGDAVEAFDLLLHKGRSGEVYNVGGKCELRNIDVVRKLLSLTGRSTSLVKHVTDRLGHDFRYALTIDKMKKEFGWRPRMSFDEGLALTVDYYRTYPKIR